MHRLALRNQSARDRRWVPCRHRCVPCMIFQNFHSLGLDWINKSQFIIIAFYSLP